MNTIHKNLPAKDFDFSDEIVKKSYCAHSGLIAGSGCTIGGTGWYKTEAVPSTCTSCYGGGQSDSEDAPAATPDAPADSPAAAPEGE